MAKLPYFQFYVADFANDGRVAAMTAREVGAYILLLCKAWHEEPIGSIPDNDVVLARWARMSAKTWEACKAQVLACFELRDDGRWHQKRMQAEAEKAHATSAARAEAGKKGGLRKWRDKENRDGKDLAQPEPGHSPAMAGPSDGHPGMANAIDLPSVCHQFAYGKMMAPDSDSKSLNSKNKIPQETTHFALTPPALAQAWCFRCARRMATGTPADTVQKMEPEFAALLELGHDPAAILAAINAKRDTGEYFWQFKKRLGLDKPPGSDPAAQEAKRREEALARQFAERREHQEHLRKLQEARQARLASQGGSEVVEAVRIDSRPILARIKGTG